MALEYTEVDGIARPNSTILFLLVGSENHDPACSDKPDELVIERTENANRSIMFGDGIHSCLGARLATLELETALGKLLTRLPNPRLTNIDDLQWNARNTLRGVTSLMATR